MTIIDANDMIVGRLCSIVAKRALLGEKIDIVNCEKAVMTGNKQQVFGKFKDRRHKGGPQSGPFILRSPDMLVKRMLRGMIPYKKQRGKLALQRLKCHIGVPKELEGEKAEVVQEAHMSRLQTMKFVKIEDICKSMGAKL
ncbi:50S ribosomal protein L13 [Candidatus Woesearchaeota archaeon]|nr:50S ribosomal protein L13 [Candidatus Woesearchaeota archaeon]